ncbi:hypothetical protein LTR35_017520 [Friedmanniomyces endolithicus]|uniref:DUF7924 domain-containing protein n=1 Tax=Friedmanniomyces endolithicus TaxID=329885 RepID=A0AAN6IZK5_9PEZI|nr:hypothetical protein LTR35_017520 [Friedmanniomyces endolithicus]KAK0268706.1 hypothetical protein LTS00_017484 [Friedmanniomyces endolithicus]KAK0303243.1 hypothetical protein LTR82_017623 [Friedmanniomyces endolithicus]KAK0971925.1 hypothetical protein LTR54_017689 [Friedmanniomyces endolithicus]
MSPQGEYPELERLRKRSLPHSFDGCDSENPRPPKRHQQLPPTPSTPSHSLDRFFRPSPPEDVPLKPPEPSQFSKKRRFEDDNPAPNPQNKRRVEDWLRSTRPRRKSCPARLELKVPDSDKGQRTLARSDSCPPRPQTSDPDPGNGQRPLLEVLQEMSQSQQQSQKQSCGAGSITSGRNARSVTYHPDYRSTLRNNRIHIDHTGKKIPPELREVLDSSILKQQSEPLTAEAIAEAVQTAIEIADSPENNIYDLNGTAMLPIKRSDVGRGGNTPWYTDTLPKSDAYDTPLAQPKPDVHCGYLTGQRSTWTIEENAVIDHQRAKKITQPARGNSFPFFVFEMKSEAMGGTLWHAENQAAGSGACCVNAMRWLYREAYSTNDQPVVESMAFSACVTHREVVFHVHHYSTADNLYYMSLLEAFQTVRQVEECNNVHALGSRQEKTREQLKLLHPFPAHWKKTRLASVMAPQNPATDEDDTANDDASNKSQRTE